MTSEKRYQITAHRKSQKEAIISLLQLLFRHQKCANTCKRISVSIMILMKRTVWSIPVYVCPQMLVHRIGPGMVQQIQRPCSHCSGKGETMNG